MDRMICVHGHFYQPPRENPWLEAVELQDSADPYHDWNERITAECYAPNGASRILDSRGRIERIVNNYSQISFNFGPTLLSWLSEKSPETHAMILEADRIGARRFGGHGPALAQAYNHMILPLANRRDKRTQILWGIADFRHRFGRDPEGMWLAETAVDLESLDLMAEEGIRFTILAPRQASRIRRMGGGAWKDVSGDRVDPSMPYEVRLPSGRTIAVFFYDGPISRAVAFEGLLADGRRFADRLLGGLSDRRNRPQLAHIATDGETYGHHHRHGEMALTYALHEIERMEGVGLTIHAQFLEEHPPTHIAEVFDSTSWSCVHGVERWWTDCGCSSGMHAGWNQAWRTPLRNALDWLRDRLADAYEQKGERVLRQPWEARDDYIRVVLDRSDRVREEFLGAHRREGTSEDDEVAVWKLLEMQRHAMLMYTSCGWFFDEISGIETVQVLQYAGRAIQLGRDLGIEDLEGPFLERLSAAKSNLEEQGDGARIYERSVRPAMVDLNQVCAHHAIDSLVEPEGESDRIYCFSSEREATTRFEAGKAVLAIGRTRLQSRITREWAVLSHAVLHFGDHNIQAGVRGFRGEEEYEAMIAEVREVFSRGDLPEALRILDRRFDGVTYSLKSLFRDEQRRVVRRLLQATLEEAEAGLRSLYENHAPMIRFLADVGTPPPMALRASAEFVLNANLLRILSAPEPDLDRLETALDGAMRERVPLDRGSLGLEVARNLEALLDALRKRPDDLPTLRRAARLAILADSLPFEVDLWRCQNLFYRWAEEISSWRRGRVDREGEEREWADLFRSLAEKMAVRVE
ncbi:MAG: DUF3536 domain-containing protein [Candidatus Eisenbacteria bacterium]|nr:DUF3536 domain-containing protein [Candidatus Latescibacterota bacterium]MBD3301322.1 DUF3536 domain-containing protein [Candidatus Eisenbacteria bacterium]